MLRFKEALRNRAAAENVPLHRIFLQEQARPEHNRAAILQIPGYLGVESMMRRSRRQGTPNIPRNLQAVHLALMDSRYEYFTYYFI